MEQDLNWWEQLEQTKGSRPRCILLADSPDKQARESVAARLTELVGIDDVAVKPHDRWMPYGRPAKRENGTWDTSSSREAKLGEPNIVVDDAEVQHALTSWWLEITPRANTPNWDVASTCTIGVSQGVLLIEAKAHLGELASTGKKAPTTLNGW